MFDLFIMDLGGNDANVQNLVQRFPHAKVVRYYDNHLDTLKRCISRCRTPYAWVIASVCDYTAFDFDYKPVPWEAYQLHCWHSDHEKFGDTFLVNVSEFNKQKDIPLLEWYKDVNWHYPGVPRLPIPEVTYTSDDLVDIVKSAQFNTPYILFKRDVDSTVNFAPILWRDRAVHTFNRANSVSLVPREISTHLNTQIYDYPHLIKQKEWFLGDKNLDIIYISNGETDADKLYNHLCTVAEPTTICQRITNVNGRAQAIKKAAMLSSTDWFFAVPAKLEVNADFDWTWQPDYLQEPKHYIFHALNPINGLEYGHMAMIAYNKRLVLATDEHGLDFTMSKAHAVIPLRSGTAYYNSDRLMTWRTAFREALKLKDDIVKTKSVESTYRLDIWLTTAEGVNANWSLRGARDAVDYYEAVNGDYAKLMLSFDWTWLQQHFNTIYHDQRIS